MRNPFEYGRELSSDELVDRVDEVAAVVRTIRDAGTLFLIGPRRYGKTSILQVASQRAMAEHDAIVLRYDAEAHPRLDVLAERLVADAARQLTTLTERTTERAAKLFGRLRPRFSVNPADGAVSVTFDMTGGPRGDIPLITDALDGIDRLAASVKRPVAVIIDEFQRLVEDGGRDAEGQLRSVIQRHRHTGYVFAGSNTRLMALMTTDPGRPFYNMGQRWFVGPVARPGFIAFLHKGFRTIKATVDDHALTHLLDVAADVPYNVQMLAHECWDTLHERPESRRRLTAPLVTEAAQRLARRLDSLYSQWWLQLTAAQQTALTAFVRERGEGLSSAETLGRYHLTASLMQKAVTGLHEKGILREDVALGKTRARLGDPFFGIWVTVVTASEAVQS